MVESWKKLKTSNVFSAFIVCSNGNRSDTECLFNIVCETCNNISSVELLLRQTKVDQQITEENIQYIHFK